MKKNLNTTTKATSRNVTSGNLALSHEQREIVCTPNQNMCEAIIANCIKSDGGVLYAAIPLELMDLDKSYQRMLKPHYKEIAGHWDENKCGVLTVSYRDGRFYVVDGQHRFEAAKICGVKRLYCLVHTGWTQADEARAFVQQDDLKKPVSGAAKLRAGCIWKDNTALAVKSVCDKYNVVCFPETSGQVGALTATDKAMRIVRTHGVELLDDIFHLIDRLDWRMEPNGYSGTVLYAARNVLLPRKDRDAATEMIVKAMGKGGFGLHPLGLRDVLNWAQREYPNLNRTEALTKAWGNLVSRL